MAQKNSKMSSTRGIKVDYKAMLAGKNQVQHRNPFNTLSREKHNYEVASDN